MRISFNQKSINISFVYLTQVSPENQEKGAKKNKTGIFYADASRKNIN